MTTKMTDAQIETVARGVIAHADHEAIVEVARTGHAGEEETESWREEDERLPDAIVEEARRWVAAHS